jgi:hypothetical protein
VFHLDRLPRIEGAIGQQQPDDEPERHSGDRVIDQGEDSAERDELENYERCTKTVIH